MQIARRVSIALLGLAACAGLLLAGPVRAAKAPIDTAVAGFADRYAQVNGIRIHYKIGGHGSPVVLLHGYAQTGHMWIPAMGPLAQKHTVIVPDLRGAGSSDKPDSGYDKKTMANDIHELVKSITAEPAALVGHDIGLMVAYAYAAQYPQDSARVVFMDAFLPGIGDWKNAFPAQAVWHFHFYGETPLKLVKGRERIYFDHFWNDMSADKTKSVKEADRKLYTAAYSQPGGMRAGFSYFSDFERDAVDFAQLAQTKLAMPVLTLAGDKSAGSFLGQQIQMVATNVQSIILHDCGHWLIDEAPEQVVPALVLFVDQP
jgi:pimeloyl-ACP methyl ester carboxylesterase